MSPVCANDELRTFDLLSAILAASPHPNDSSIRPDKLIDVRVVADCDARLFGRVNQ